MGRRMHSIMELEMKVVGPEVRDSVALAPLNGV